MITIATTGTNSALTVCGLLNTPHLQLSVAAGEAGLDRPLVWTHVSELEEPAAWLDGGELLMTNGLGLPRDSDGQVRLIADLDDRHAAGLAIGVRGPDNLEPLLQEADQRAFPVLRIPVDVPFLTIARFVADANQQSAHQRLLRHVRIFDTLRPGSAPVGIENLFVRLEEVSGYDLHLVSAAGTPMSLELRPPPEEVLAHLRDTAGQSDARRPKVPGGYSVPVSLEQREDAVLIALERDTTSPAGLGAVHHISTIVGLELSKTYYERETLRRRGSEALSRFHAGQLPTLEAEAAMEQAGFDARAEIVVAAIRSTDDGFHDEEIHHRLCDLQVPNLLHLDHDLYAVLPLTRHELHEAIRDLPVICGVSGPRPGIHGWSVARKEAAWALERAAGEPDSAQVVYFLDSNSAAHWLPSNIGTLEGLVSEILGPLLQYDAEHNSTMLETLQVFFRHDRQLQDAAAELIVHKHTLSYRLKRIGEITNRNLNSMADQVQLWLALQAYEIVASNSEVIFADLLNANARTG